MTQFHLGALLLGSLLALLGVVLAIAHAKQPGKRP